MMAVKICGEAADSFHDLRDGLVSDRVYALLVQALAQLCVPVVLDVVVRPAWKVVRD